jgi:DNA-binding CsgD family transcriptional regulator
MKGYCDTNIGRQVASISVKPKERVYITEEELLLITEKIPDETSKCMMLTMFYTGMRIGEAIALTFEDLHFDEGYIHIRKQKSIADRIIPISIKLRIVLDEYIEYRNEIDNDIVRGKSQRAIASQYNVSPASVARHKSHIRELLEVNEELQADKLAQEITELQKITLDILEDSMASKDKRSSLQAIKEARSNIELLAKLTGAIGARIKVEMEKGDNAIQIVYANDFLQHR